MRRLRRWKRRGVYLLARALIAVWAALPFAIGLSVGRAIGFLVWLFARRLVGRARAQLEAALGVDRSESARIARRMFRHLGLVAAELAQARAVRRRFDRYVRFPAEDEARLRAALADGGGKGVVGVTAHLGNWELLAQRVARAGIPIITLARPNPNPDLGRWLVELRKEGGVETIDRGESGGAARMLRALRKGALLAALIDQDTKVPSVFVPFFGRDAATPVGPAELAIRARTPVIAGFITREAVGHVVRIERLSVEGLPEEERARALTARMTQAIESAVRGAPEQWVWFHERWKRQPG